jgi:hypothetical protein
MLYIKIPESCMLVKKRMDVARRLKNAGTLHATSLQPIINVVIIFSTDHGFPSEESLLLLEPEEQEVRLLLFFLQNLLPL